MFTSTQHQILYINKRLVHIFVHGGSLWHSVSSPSKWLAALGLVSGLA